MRRPSWIYTDTICINTFERIFTTELKYTSLADLNKPVARSTCVTILRFHDCLVNERRAPARTANTRLGAWVMFVGSSSSAFVVDHVEGNSSNMEYVCWHNLKVMHVRIVYVFILVHAHYKPTDTLLLKDIWWLWDIHRIEYRMELKIIILRLFQNKCFFPMRLFKTITIISEIIWLFVFKLLNNLEFSSIC